MAWCRYWTWMDAPWGVTLHGSLFTTAYNYVSVDIASKHFDSLLIPWSVFFQVTMVTGGRVVQMLIYGISYMSSKCCHCNLYIVWFLVGCIHRSVAHLSVQRERPLLSGVSSLYIRNVSDCCCQSASIKGDEHIQPYWSVTHSCGDAEYLTGYQLTEVENRLVVALLPTLLYAVINLCDFDLLMLKYPLLLALFILLRQTPF